LAISLSYTTPPPSPSGHAAPRCPAVFADVASASCLLAEGPHKPAVALLGEHASAFAAVGVFGRGLFGLHLPPPPERISTAYGDEKVANRDISCCNLSSKAHFSRAYFHTSLISRARNDA
jgi:hypothetical protein